jgi:hypothetical protein
MVAIKSGSLATTMQTIAFPIETVKSREYRLLGGAEVVLAVDHRRGLGEGRVG